MFVYTKISAYTVWIHIYYIYYIYYILYIYIIYYIHSTSWVCLDMSNYENRAQALIYTFTFLYLIRRGIAQISRLQRCSFVLLSTKTTNGSPNFSHLQVCDRSHFISLRSSNGIYRNHMLTLKNKRLNVLTVNNGRKKTWKRKVIYLDKTSLGSLASYLG